MSYRTIFHRDHSITLWNVYAQQWQRLPADQISDEVLASLAPKERDRIIKMRQMTAQESK